MSSIHAQQQEHAVFLARIQLSAQLASVQNSEVGGDSTLKIYDNLIDYIQKELHCPTMLGVPVGAKFFGAAVGYALAIVIAVMGKLVSIGST